MAMAMVEAAGAAAPVPKEYAKLCVQCGHLESCGRSGARGVYDFANRDGDWRQAQRCAVCLGKQGKGKRWQPLDLADVQQRWLAGSGTHRVNWWYDEGEGEGEGEGDCLTFEHVNRFQ